MDSLLHVTFENETLNSTVLRSSAHLQEGSIHFYGDVVLPEFGANAYHHVEIKRTKKWNVDFFGNHGSVLRYKVIKPYNDNSIFTRSVRICRYKVGLLLQSGHAFCVIVFFLTMAFSTKIEFWDSFNCNGI